MNPSEVKQIKRRILQSIAKELGGKVVKGDFSRHAKSPDYSLYGRDHYISDAPKPKKAPTKAVKAKKKTK